MLANGIQRWKKLSRLHCLKTRSSSFEKRYGYKRKSLFVAICIHTETVKDFDVTLLTDSISTQNFPFYYK